MVCSDRIALIGSVIQLKSSSLVLMVCSDNTLFRLRKNIPNSSLMKVEWRR